MITFFLNVDVLFPYMPIKSPHTITLPRKHKNVRKSSVLGRFKGSRGGDSGRFSARFFLGTLDSLDLNVLYAPGKTAAP